MGLPVEELMEPLIVGRADERLEIVPEIRRVMSAHMGVESCKLSRLRSRLECYCVEGLILAVERAAGGETAIAWSELRVVKLLTGLFTPSLLPLESIDSTV